MLGKLDNQVIFKKAFTDKIVLEAFVKDVLGIDFEAATIETEKQFSPKVGNIDFKLDIFAESADQRVVVEIQRVQYDQNFDRLLHYFLMTIAEQQRSGAPYRVERTVYVIVVMTAPYRFDTKKGQAVRDEVLLLKAEGFDYDEIAATTGLAKGAIGTTIARARRRLVEAYRAEEMDRHVAS